MNSKLLKAYRDLMSNPRRSLMVILGLALGIWGVGSVLVAYSILRNDLNSNFLSTSPPHVILTSQQFETLDIKEIERMADVEVADYRDFSLQRIEVKPNYWIPLWIFGVEDFKNSKMAHVFYEKGAKTPPHGTLLMERDGLLVSNLNVGSLARVRIGNKVTNLPISGICFDPAQAPATQDAFIYAYTDKASYKDITGKSINHRLIVRFKGVKSRDDVKTATSKLVNTLSSMGIVVQSIDMPKFNEHPHQWQLNTLLFLIGAIGFLAFIMGAVLVMQLMRAIMNSQIRQIGILKAIGAKQWEVFYIYIIMILALGIASALISVPLAILTGTKYAYFIAIKLNFNIITTSIPVWISVSLALTSILLPVLLSVGIIYKGSSVTVKEALSNYGISYINRKFKSTIFTHNIANKSLTLAWRNTLRKPKQIITTVVTMALGVAIFSTGFNVEQALQNVLTSVKSEMKYDVQLALNTPIDTVLAKSLFTEIPNLKEIELWGGGRGALQTKALSTDNGVGIVALPYNTELLKLDITRGRWMGIAEIPEIVMNQQACEMYKNPSLGDLVEIKVGKEAFKAKLVGVVEQLDKAKLYIDKGQFDTLFNTNGLINTVVFVAKNKSYKDVIQLKHDIEKRIESSDLNIAFVMSDAERVKIIYDHLIIILTTIITLSFLVLAVSAIGMGSSTSINIGERTREIGVMRAIGAIPQQIYAIFLYEGLIISIFSIVLGLIIAYPLSLLASIFFGKLMLGDGATLTYAFSTVGFFVTIITTTLFGYISSKIPVKSIINIPTHKALSYE